MYRWHEPRILISSHSTTLVQKKTNRSNVESEIWGILLFDEPNKKQTNKKHLATNYDNWQQVSIMIRKKEQHKDESFSSLSAVQMRKGLLSVNPSSWTVHNFNKTSRDPKEISVHKKQGWKTILYDVILWPQETLHKNKHVSLIIIMQVKTLPYKEETIYKA